MMMITEVSRSEHSELCTTAVAGTPGWESRAACLQRDRKSVV